MASSVLSSSFTPSLSSLRPRPPSSPSSLPSLFSSPKPSHPLPTPLTVHAGTKKSYTAEEKQRFLESYGLDPADYAPTPPPHKTERRGRGKGKRGVEAVEEIKKVPRTTHKLLQVLGGKSRRTKLLSPKGMDVRPMMEVVRGAAFDILQVAGGSPASLRPGRWLDLYSGTGSVGIEALSRGCSEVHFVELDPWVVSEVLRPNLECTGYLDVSVIHTTRVESFLEKAEKSLGIGKTFDYVSITPPYTAVDYMILLEQVGKSPLVGEDCFILVEYPLESSILDSCGHLKKATNKVAAALIGSSLVFALVPLKHLFMLALLEVYTREMPLRKESSETLIRRIREWWVRIPAAPVLLIKPQDHKKIKMTV